MQKRFGAQDSVRCSEFRGGRFSEVANVLQVWDFQSVTRTLSALGSVSAQGGSTVAGNFCETEIFAIFAIKHQLAKICSREKNFPPQISC